MDYSAQGYKNIDKTDEDKARSSRTRILVCGGLLTIIITISVIIGVVLNQKSMLEDQDSNTSPDTHAGKGKDKNDAGQHFDKCDSDHPMCQFYHEEPKWSEIASRQDPETGVKADDDIKAKFWEDAMFGGPIFEDVKILNDDGTIARELGNSLEDKLKENYDARDNHHGLFVIKNLHQYDRSQLAKYFVDVTFYANNIDEETFNSLLAENNTQVDDGVSRQWADYSPKINGWGRMVFYKVSEATFFPETTKYDPRHPESNDFLQVFEGYFENGLVSSEPRFGRQYIMGDKCNVGYFVQKPNTSNTLAAMNGKGIQIQQSNQHEEGIWIPSDLVNVFEQKDIDNFNENELAPQ